MPRKPILTDEEVELEIARLTKTEPVRLARAEIGLRYRRRRVLYNLRNLEKRGKELMELGVTHENIEEYAKIEYGDEE